MLNIHTFIQRKKNNNGLNRWCFSFWSQSFTRLKLRWIKFAPHKSATHFWDGSGVLWIQQRRSHEMKTSSQRLNRNKKLKGFKKSTRRLYDSQHCSNVCRRSESLSQTRVQISWLLPKRHIFLAFPGRGTLTTFWWSDELPRNHPRSFSSNETIQAAQTTGPQSHEWLEKNPREKEKKATEWRSNVEGGLGLPALWHGAHRHAADGAARSSWQLSTLLCQASRAEIKKKKKEKKDGLEHWDAGAARML